MTRISLALCAVVIACSASAAHAGGTLNLGGIIWNTDLVAAYQASLTESKPLVVMFGRESDYFCQQARLQLEEDRLLAPYRDVAVFALVDIDHDDEHGSVQQMVDSLAIDLIPTLVIFHTSTDSINEISRIRGLFRDDRMAVLLGELFKPVVFPEQATGEETQSAVPEAARPESKPETQPATDAEADPTARTALSGGARLFDQPRQPSGVAVSK